MAVTIRTLRTRKGKDGSTQALQQKVEKGKKPIPMGWVTIAPAPASSSEAAPAPKLDQADPKPKRDKGDKPPALERGENFLGWVLGATATGLVVVGAAWLLFKKA